MSWESTFAIAMELRRKHPNIDFDTLQLKQIYDWTLELQDFDDDPSLANDEILYSIFQDWYEENLNDERKSQ
jgi:FeS assembly protein IscX